MEPLMFVSYIYCSFFLFLFSIRSRFLFCRQLHTSVPLPHIQSASSLMLLQSTSRLTPPVSQSVSHSVASLRSFSLSSVALAPFSLPLRPNKPVSLFSKFSCCYLSINRLLHSFPICRVSALMSPLKSYHPPAPLCSGLYLAHLCLEPFFIGCFSSH